MLETYILIPTRSCACVSELWSLVFSLLKIDRVLLHALPYFFLSLEFPDQGLYRLAIDLLGFSPEMLLQQKVERDNVMFMLIWHFSPPPQKKKYKYKSPRQKEHKLIKEHNISKRERGYVTQVS